MSYESHNELNTVTSVRQNWHTTTMLAYSKEEEKVDKTREEAIFQIDGLENCYYVSVSSGTQWFFYFFFFLSKMMREKDFSLNFDHKLLKNFIFYLFICLSLRQETFYEFLWILYRRIIFNSFITLIEWFEDLSLINFITESNNYI